MRDKSTSVVPQAEVSQLCGTTSQRAPVFSHLQKDEGSTNLPCDRRC